MIEIENLGKQFDTVEAVKNVSIEVPHGAFLVLLGPSGCGKTTLLRMLAGLEIPTTGTIKFGNHLVSNGDQHWIVDPSKRNSGLVFQSYALWPHMTVKANVEWPLKVAKWSALDRGNRIKEVLEMLNISELKDRYPDEISGGQQQRVAIARTIAPKPHILLFDEPLSNLDAKLRVEMRTELMQLHWATSATTVYVTHDQIEAMTMASHVAVMNHGKVEQFGTPLDLVNNPKTAFVATFVGTPPNNLVPFDIIDNRLIVLEKSLFFDNPPINHGFAMFRAEDIHVSESETGNSIPMALVEISSIAGRIMVTAIRNDLRITALMDSIPKAELTHIIYMTLPRSPVCWFNQNGVKVE